MNEKEKKTLERRRLYMRCLNNHIVLLSGTIKKIRFEGISAFVDIDGKTEMEFKNTKTPRADHVRKLRLDVGNHVIAIGEKVGESYIFGYDIQKDGKVSSDDYALVKGSIENIKKLLTTDRMTLSASGKKYVIERCKVPKTEHIKYRKGDCITCLCMKHNYVSCIEPCGKWATRECFPCRKRRRVPRLEALQIEKCA